MPNIDNINTLQTLVIDYPHHEVKTELEGWFTEGGPWTSVPLRSVRSTNTRVAPQPTELAALGIESRNHSIKGLTSPLDNSEVH